MKNKRAVLVYLKPETVERVRAAMPPGSSPERGFSAWVEYLLTESLNALSHDDKAATKER